MAAAEWGELGPRQKVGDGWGDSLRPEDLVVLARWGRAAEPLVGSGEEGLPETQDLKPLGGGVL